MKRLLSFLLCAVVSASLLAACTQKQAGTQNNAPPPPPAKLTIGLPVNARVLDYKNNALTKYLEKEANCKLEFIPYSGGYGLSCVPSPIPDVEPVFPDIIWGVNLEDAPVSWYSRDGMFLNLSSYFANRNGAAKVFWDRVEENYNPYEIENIKRKMVDPNTGGIYFIPTLGTSLLDTMDYQAYINTTWLDTLGLPMPTDPESLYNTLVAFKKQDPNGNGKTDEIPIYGSEVGGNGADVINYLVNMFLYFDDQKHFFVDENGQLYAPFISDKYREALQYINKLYAEKLLIDAVFTTVSKDMQRVSNPVHHGYALVGVFCGNLNDHWGEDSPFLEQYATLPYFKGQSMVFNDDFFVRNIFITKDCKDPDAAFRLIMKMYEEETSWRIRYGEYGVNWDYASEGAVSDYGLPAKIKVIDDPIEKSNGCLWSSTSGTLLEYLDGENVIWPEETTDWQKMRNAMSVQSRKNADAAASNNPDTLCPYLAYTEEELNQTEKQRTDVAAYYTKSRSDFIKNKLDPYLDSDWNAYVKQVKDYGLDAWLAVAQAAYDRVPNL